MERVKFNGRPHIHKKNILYQIMKLYDDKKEEIML